MNSQFSRLSDYESDSNSNETEFNQSSISSSTKKRSKGIIYSPVQTFESEKEKNDFISSAWRTQRKHEKEFGLKEYLYCAIDRKNCCAVAYLLYDNRNEEIKLFMGDIEHDHQKSISNRMTDELKQQIREIYESRVVKPSQILRQLVKKEVNLLPKLNLTKKLFS